MKHSFWKLIVPREVRSVVGEGEAARRKAEVELARVRSQTPYYAGLGRDLRAYRERNHIADRIRATIREA